MNLDEFKTFLRSHEEPSKQVSESLFAQVNASLNPALSLVLFKFLVVHIFAGGVTLLFCPQLGVGPVMYDIGMGHLFMAFGPVACAAGCGGLFLGLSFFASALLLRREEIRRLRHLEVANITVFAALSYAVLMVAGADDDKVIYLAWIFGAVVGGTIFYKLGTWLRFGSRPSVSYN